MKQSVPTLLIMIAMLLLTACNSAPSGPVPTPRPGNAPTTEPLGKPTSSGTLDPNCPSRQLETWLSRSSANARGFMDTLNASAAITPAQAVAVASQLSGFRSAIERFTPPRCAAEEASLVFDFMTKAITALNDYASNKPVALTKIITDANAAYAGILTKQKQLQDLLTAMFNAGQ